MRGAGSGTVWERFEKKLVKGFYAFKETGKQLIYVERMCSPLSYGWQ